MGNSGRSIKGLAEASIRAKDLNAMHEFYENVVGLEVLRRDESFVFFKIAEGYGGHLQNLALFDAAERTFLEAKSLQLSEEQTTLHHIALNVALENFEPEKRRLEGLGLKRYMRPNTRGFMSDHYTSPIRRGIHWSLSLTRRVWRSEPRSHLCLHKWPDEQNTLTGTSRRLALDSQGHSDEYKQAAFMILSRLSAY